MEPVTSRSPRDRDLAQLRWLSLKEVCDAWGYSKNKIHDFRARGLLPLTKIDGRWRITLKAFERAEREMFKKFGRR